MICIQCGREEGKKDPTCGCNMCIRCGATYCCPNIKFNFADLFVSYEAVEMIQTWDYQPDFIVGVKNES